MIINKKIVFFCSLLVFLISCKDDISLDDMSGKIVIEGNITDGDGPYFVKVTKSRKFLQNNQEAPITNATVVISDNHGQKETLKYEPEDEVYRTLNFHTDYGDNYVLSVTVDNITYKATSTMPQYVKLDNLKQEMIFTEDGSVTGVIPIFTDPILQRNFYLFKSQLNNKYRLEYTTLSDIIGNGQVNSKPLSITAKLKKNDTLFVEMQCIDEPIYNYFKALPQASLDNSGDTVTPINPPSNFSNGALGYFSAHTSSTRSIIIQ